MTYIKQSWIPHGATLLGTILSSDKTNITTLSGGRVAHPLLIGSGKHQNVHQTQTIVPLIHARRPSSRPQVYSPK